MDSSGLRGKTVVRIEYHMKHTKAQFPKDYRQTIFAECGVV
jgi:hypothetical protein